MAIEVFRHNGKWRMKIINETLEFDNFEDISENLENFMKLKEKKEPYKHDN